MRMRAINAIIAVVLSLLPLPAMSLFEHLNRNCGDGLCGFFTGLLILGVLAMTTLVFVIRSALRGESPAVLRWVPVALWIVTVGSLLV